MMILQNATIVTAEKEAVGTVVIENGIISDVFFKDAEDYDFHLFKALKGDAEVIDLEGRWLMAGGIDAHVHFREPGSSGATTVLASANSGRSRFWTGQLRRRMNT